MAVIEGHAEHVMDVVAPDLLPSLPKLRAALDRRRKSQSGPVTAGRAAARARAQAQASTSRASSSATRSCGAAGPEALHHVWSSPEALPTLAELRDPASGWHECPANSNSTAIPRAPVARRGRVRATERLKCTRPVHELFMSAAVTRASRGVQTHVRSIPRQVYGSTHGYDSSGTAEARHHRRRRRQPRPRSARRPPHRAPPRPPPARGVPRPARPPPRSPRPATRRRRCSPSAPCSCPSAPACSPASDLVIDREGPGRQVRHAPGLERELKRYERRGATARNRFERQVRRTRTRFERELRQRRSLVERTVRQNRRRLKREAQAQCAGISRSSPAR